MTHQVLSSCLRPVLKAETQWRKRRVVFLTLSIAAALMLTLVWLARAFDWWSAPLAVTVLLGAVLVLGCGLIWVAWKKPDLKKLARQVEEKHPDLNSLLVTAVDMNLSPGSRVGYLQSQVLGQVTEHAIRNRWVRQVSNEKLARAGWLQFFSLIAFFGAAWLLLGQFSKTGANQITEDVSPLPPRPVAVPIEISVSPGDTEVEKGSRVIVEATFSGRIPPGAVVVLSDPDDGSERGRLPMRAGIDDAVFSALISKVDSPAKYQVRFEEDASDSFTISTYEHPRLDQADVTITPPAYARKEPRTVEDVRKVSLLEGSQIAWSIQVSKPVAHGELFGEDESVVELRPSPDDPSILLASHIPQETKKYRLHLVDDKDRANKRPPWFTVTVKKNLPPKLEFAFPKRDVDVTSVEELTVQTQLWDDLGIQNAGIVFAHDGKNKEVLLTTQELPGDKRHQLSTMLAIEELGAKPRDLISYYLWAEDLDREGKIRRSMSDMFLAEVRHFEDIFREQQSQSGQGQQQGQGESEKLLKLQKDILNATWKVLRHAHLGKSLGDLSDDIEVLRESQGIAIQKTDEAVGRVEDAEVKAFFLEAKEHMKKAVEHFTITVDPFSDPDLKTPPVEPLELAHASVRSAYESLIKARSREHNVSQSQQPSQGQSQQRQQQLMNLELKQKDLKYKENSSAQTGEESAEQKENLEVLNKLKELARRQEAIAKKIKELQNQLEEAKTEEEREEIRRQLKRLQEEQQELLRELDDLSERMDSEENRADMAEERQKLEETRENVKNAAQQLKDDQLADAANSATRAQRDLKEVEDEFRKKTSRQFSKEMQGIRQAARELAENQDEISKQLDDKAPAQTNTGNYFRTTKENQDLSESLDQQRESLEKLIDEMKTISEQAEESEPLLSDALYEAVRETTVNGVEQSLAEAGRLVRYNHRNAAREPEQNAAQGIDDLKKKVEAAAEKILGSEADSLRLARAELDRLIEQSKTEANRLSGGEQEEDWGRESGEQPRPGRGEPSQDRESAGKGSRQESKGKSPGSGKGDEGGQPKNSEKGEKGPGAEKGEKAGSGKGRSKGDPKGKSQKGEGQKGKGKGEGQKGKGDQSGNGDQSGEGKSSESQLAQAENGKGQGKGQGSQKGEDGKGQGKSQSSPKGQGKGQGQGQGSPKGKGSGKGQGDSETQMAEANQESQGQDRAGQTRERGRSLLSGGDRNQRRRAAGSNFGGDDRGRNLAPPSELTGQAPLFFNQSREQPLDRGPITGEEYKEFANSLGNIEEMMPQEDLRNEAAKVLDNARAMRIDYKRDNLPPGAAEIRKKIIDPLVELRGRVSEELAKLNRDNPLAPIDRDPVPGEFRELVRKYYEELGAGE